MSETPNTEQSFVLAPALTRERYRQISELSQAGRCINCGVVLDVGTANTFTVCDPCWDQAYRSKPSAPPSPGDVTGPLTDDDRQRLASIRRGIPHMNDAGGIWPRDVEFLLALVDRAFAVQTVSRGDVTGTPAPAEGAAKLAVPRPGIGMPTALLLDEFGALVHDAFGEFPYHVGSSLLGKQWRDVDVRLMLDDEQYEAMGLGDPGRTHDNPTWVAFVRAFAALGREMTGLPIDFQIQQRSYANATFPHAEGHIRGALGIHRMLRTGAIK